MKHKRMTISIVLATVMLVSLFAVVSSAASVSGQTMAGTGPAVSGFISATAVPAGYNGYADFFAVDTSGTLWHTPMNGNNTWDSLGGVCTSSPAAVYPPSSSTFSLDVFVRGSSAALYWKHYQNGWSSWQSLGGQLASGTGPAACSWGAGRLDVFVEGTNGALWHKWSTNGGTSWSGWESLGGKLTASPAATSNSTNNILVFARGTDGAVWWKHWNGSVWSTWTSLGGQVTANTGPAVSQFPWLIVQGTDHQLWEKYFEEAGRAWQSLGVAPPEVLSTSSPGAVMFPVMDHTMVCFTSTSGNVWYGIQNSEGIITQWTSAGSPA